MASLRGRRRTHAPAGDLLAVSVNNGSGSKIDYYADRAIDYDVRLGGDGEAIATATVTIANHAPTRGQPRYVIGPFIDGAAPGDQIPLTTVSCHQPCELLTATRDGTDVSLGTGSENRIPWLGDYRTIPAGDDGRVVAHLARRPTSGRGTRAADATT